MNRLHETVRPLDTRIDSALVSQIYARSNIGIVATAVNAVIFVGVLWGQIRHRRLIAWFAALGAASFTRFLLNRQFSKRRML